jgi:hypothetical protein
LKNSPPAKSGSQTTTEGGEKPRSEEPKPKKATVIE